MLFGLIAVLVLDVGYPARFEGALGSCSLLGTQIDLPALPLAGLLSVSWVFTLAIILKYSQAYICYCFPFPVVAALAMLTLCFVEAMRLPYPLSNKILDVEIGVAVIVSPYLYRWHPPREKFGELKETVVRRFRGRPE